MNWDAIGAIGEIAGAVLLLVSLAYVGVQIRDTKRQISAAGAQARADALRDLWKLKSEPSYLDAYMKNLEDPSSLSQKEKHILENWLYMFLSFMENNYYQRKVGMLEDSQSGALDSMPMLTENDLHREMWEDFKKLDLFSIDFRQHVESLIQVKRIT